MSNSSDILMGLVAAWPARFRFHQLLVTLSGPHSADDVAVAVVSGICEDQNETEVFHSLLAEGHFELAEKVLDACPEFPGADVGSLSTQLDIARKRRQQELLRQIKGITETAQDAGLHIDMGYDPKELEERCHSSWPDVAEVLEQLRANLALKMKKKRAELDERFFPHSSRKDAWAEQILALMNSGHFLIAEKMLDHPETRAVGPVTVPPPIRWGWAEEPEEVLRWHLDPTLHRPPRFIEWRTPEGSSAHRLLDSYEALHSGGSGTAGNFAAALDSFLLGQEISDVTVHAVEGGHLTTLTGVYKDSEISGFRPTGAVDLFVADPETTMIPPMDEIGPFIAVGTSLGPHKYTERSDAALLDLKSLLRLATVRRRRQIALLRLIGPQWPLTAFSALLPREAQSPLPKEELQSRLAWVIDLTGLGTIRTTMELAFDTALDPELIHLLLDFLADSPVEDHHGKSPIRWADSPPTVMAVERAFLKHLSIPARIMLWASLLNGVPNRDVSVDDMLLDVGLFCDEPLTPTWEELLRQGCAELSTLSTVRQASRERVEYLESGVLFHFSAVAEQRLPSAIRDLEQEESATGSDTPHATDHWEFHRHALTPELQEYRALMRSPQRSEEQAREALERLTESTLKMTAGPVEGECDLVSVLEEVAQSFRERHPNIRLLTENPETAPIASSVELVHVLLYELLSNAAEALGDSGGSVLARVEPLQGDVALDIKDSGPGIDYPPGSEHLLYRRNESTRGSGRGQGLYRSRLLLMQLGGELSLQARNGTHPVFTGAHFRLIFPSD